ncbi:MAG: SMP-30/gluconolactonase/LRE family protein [Novosphingobium sp.]|nr:SMP-30/gluconolactonase/LRE family protein [Novosphingobium sp.]
MEASVTATADSFEVVAKGIYLEGLTVDYARDIVWYSDVIAGGIHGVRRDGSKTAVLNPERKWTGGVMMNEDGAVLSSGAGGIMWNNPDTGASGWLISEVDGKPINGINEMVADGSGGIYCGTVDIEKIEKGETVRPASIYRVTADREVIIVAEGLGFANGIMRSPDGRHLYYNDTFDATYVFDIAGDLSLANRRQLLSKEDCDGMALDGEGNLWITGYRSGEITRMRPDGSLLPPVPTPAGGITQVRFGGSDMREFYLTSVTADAGDTLKVGGVPTEQLSFLYRGRSDTPGMRLAPPRFRLG